MKYDHAYKLYVHFAVSERLYSQDSLRQLRDVFRNWITPALGNGEAEDISLTRILSLRSAMGSLSVSRQGAVLNWMRGFLTFCHTHLKLSVLNPAEIRLPPRSEPNVVYLTNAEVRQLIAAIPKHTYTGKRLRALVELLLGTGARIGEALALDRTPFESGYKNLDIVGKAGRRRTIFFTERALTWIHTYLRARFDTEHALFVTTGDHPRRVARADISKMFIDLRKRAGIAKKVTPHMLRHTYCTNLHHNGVDIRFIRDLAGHRDIQTTSRYYLGVDYQKLREVVDTKLNYGFVQTD